MRKDNGYRLRIGLNPRYKCKMYRSLSVMYSAKGIEMVVEVTPTGSLREEGPVFNTVMITEYKNKIIRLQMANQDGREETYL